MSLTTTLRSTWDYLDVVHSVRYPGREERHALRDVLAGRRMEPPRQVTMPRTVVLLPGFLDDGRGVAPLAARLRAAGHDAFVADIGRNVACAEVMVGRVIEQLREAVARSGAAVTVIGHSRGGSLARVAAVREPELFAGLVALGSPLSQPDGVNLPLRLIRVGMGVATRLGASGLVGECLTGTCCVAFKADQVGPFPQNVPFVSVRGIHDGMVSPDAVTDDAARVIDVDACHAGLPVAPDAVLAVEAVLAEWGLPQAV